MAVEVIDKIKPKNGGSFPVVEAVDVEVSDGLRLPEALNQKADQSDLDALVTTVGSKANTSDVTAATDNLQAQIDQIITPVTQDAEVQNARVGADGTSYNTLKARLDAENNNIKGDISDVNVNLRRAINSLTVDLTHQYLDGYRIATGAIGDIVDITPTANSSYACIALDCSENDEFVLTGVGGTTYRVYALLDNANKIIQTVEPSTIDAKTRVTNETIIIPTGAVKLIANADKSYDYSLKQNSIIKKTFAKVDDITDINANLNDVVENFSIDLTSQYVKGYRVATGDPGSTADLTPVANSGFAFFIIDCSENDEFVITGTAGTTYRAWAFIDNNDKVLDSSGLHADNATITAPLNSKKLVVNANLANDYSLIKKSIKIKDMTESISNILNLIGLNGEIKFTKKFYIANNADNIADAVSNPIASATWRYAIVPASEGDKFYVSGNSGTTPKAFTFVDSSYNVLLRNGFQNFNGEVIAPAHTAYLVINARYDNNKMSYYGSNKVSTEEKSAEYYNNNLVSVGKNNMIWSWWSYPQVISFKRVRNKIYWGYTTTDGFIGVAEYNLETHETIKNHLRKSKQIDDHNAAAIYIYEDGTILAAYSSGHNEDEYVRIRVSAVAECVERFGDELLLPSAGSTSYSQLIFYDNRLYVFYRSGITNWAYRYTSDKGRTWSDEVILITSEIQYYCKFMYTTTDGVIRCCMYSNPSLDDANIRQAFLHLDTGVLYDSNNTTVLGTSNVSKDNVSVLIPINSSYDTQRLLDVAITAINRPLILYAPYSTGSDSIYRIYDNGTVLDVIGGGIPLIASYLLGASWIGTDQLVVSYGSGGSDVVEILEYNNGAIQSRETVHSEERGTIPIRNSRPIADINGNAILWQRGYYGATYTAFNMDADIHLLEPEE